MFTTPSRVRDARSSTPLVGAGVGASHSANHPSRAGTPVFGGQDPLSPPSFLSPSTFRRGDVNNINESGDVSSGSLFLSTNARPRTTRARPRPSSMLAISGPNVSLLSPSSAFDREGSLINDDADMRSVAESAYSASMAGFGRRPPLLSKDAKAQLEEGTVLLGDRWVHVSAYSRLPNEVLEVLNDADLYIDAFQGHLDVQTGYACLVSRTQCFVWNYSSRGIGTGSPTCFVFPVPQYSSSSMTAINDLAHCCFIPRGANREPALLLVAPDGQTCLWEGISSSLTRQDRAQRISVPLSSTSETIVQLQRVDESTLVLATSQSRMLRVSVGSRAGMLQAEIRPFSQQRGLLSRLFGSTSAMGSSNDQVVSIAVAPIQAGKQGREVYAIGRKTLQRWQVLDQGGERLLAEQDVQQVVASNVLQLSDERYSAAQSLSFDVLDGAVQSDGQLVLLYSQAKAEHEPLDYGLAIIDAVKDAGSFVVASILALNYSNFADPRPYAMPTLSLPNGGPAAFICFADTVVAKQLESGCETFEEVIKLKDDVKNRFIGTGCDSIDFGNHAIAALSLISATSGSLLVETSVNEIRNRCTAYTSAADRQRADTERLKSKLEQALYYSESPLNPLTFQLASHLQGTLMTACEDLSRELLTFSNPISQSVAPSVDLRAALKDRLGKLRFLVQFVAACGHLEKLPQTTKRQLRADAELAAALSELWVYQNEFYTSTHSHASAAQSPLARSIETVMAEQGLGTSADDLVRKFFRHHADLTTEVLERLLKQTKSISAQPLRTRSTDVLEFNRVVMSALRAALRYRKESGALYGILEPDSGVSTSAVTATAATAATPAAPAAQAAATIAFEAWTAQSATVQLLESLFALTVNLIPDRTRELGSSIDAASTEFSGAVSEELKREHRVQAELKTQLCSLAEIALACYLERLQYLQAAAASATDSGAFEREFAVFATTYRTARPLFIRPLVTIGRSDRAFTLAEQYMDFRTLVELCNDPALKSDARTETYLERYQESFAYELYTWYVEHDQQRTLLTQKSEYHALVLSFLSQPGKERLAWLHDLALQRFAAASTKLEQLGLVESNVSQRKLMLSLAKLGYLSTLKVQDLRTVGVQKQIEFFDDHLDLIAVQDSLVALWENSVAGGFPVDLPTAGTPAADQLANEIVDTVASRLAEYAAYRQHYMQLIQQLVLSNTYLGAEDLIDLLTLKDTPESQLEDFSTAIKVLIRASSNMPESRRHACLKAIWRRSVIRDDWVSLSETNNVSDQTLLEDLKCTGLYAVLREVLGDQDGSGRHAWIDIGDLAKLDDAVSDDTDPHPVERQEQGKRLRSLLEARFHDAPDHFITLLLQDYQKEAATVLGFFEDSDLPRLANELAGLAANQAGVRSDATLHPLVDQDDSMIES